MQEEIAVMKTAQSCFVLTKVNSKTDTQYFPHSHRIIQVVSQGVAKYNASGCDYFQEEELFLQENVPAMLYGMWNQATPHTDQNGSVCIFSSQD